MNKLTRRTFGKRILAAGTLPLLTLETQQQSDTSAPQSIAGYTLSTEEQLLAQKFLSMHEKNISPLRERDLPNSLAPCFMFASPRMGDERGEDSK